MGIVKQMVWCFRNEVLFVMAKIKIDVGELSGKKYLTLSNRQLSMHLLNIDNKINSNIEYRLGWSIDRITLVGTIKQTRNSNGTIRDFFSPNISSNRFPSFLATNITRS